MRFQPLRMLRSKCAASDEHHSRGTAADGLCRPQVSGPDRPPIYQDCSDPLRIESHCTAAGGRELILWQQLASPHEDEVSIFRSDELHAPEPHSSVTIRVSGEDDLVSWQRHPDGLVREEHEGARWTVSDNPKRRDPVALPEDRRWCREVDEQRDVVHLALESKRVRSVAGYRRIDEQGPCVDASAKVVEIGEAMAPEVLSGVLAAYAVVALEHDGRIQST